MRCWKNKALVLSKKLAFELELPLFNLSASLLQSKARSDMCQETSHFTKETTFDLMSVCMSPRNLGKILILENG